MSKYPLFRIFIILICLTASARADEPLFVLQGADGKDSTGPLVKLTAWSPRVGEATALPATAWLGLRQVGKPLPELPADENLILGNGDRIPARDVRLEDEKVYFRHKDLGGGNEVSVPLSAVAVLWRLAPEGAATPETLRRRLLRTERSRDVILLRNGDTLEGTLQAIKGGQVEVEVNKKIVTTRWPQVAAVALSSELLDRRPPKGTFARVVLAEGDGSPGGRLTLTEVSSDGKRLVGTTTFAAGVNVPLTRVLLLERGGDDVVDLTSLEPAKYDYSPYLDEKWAWARDAAATDRDLRLGGSVYTRGIGMHGPSRLTYALGGNYRRFVAEVGLDDRDGKAGRVRLRVLIDGRPVELSKDGVQRVGVDITGAKELTLEVRCPGGPVQAVVDWVSPRLVK